VSSQERENHHLKTSRRTQIVLLMTGIAVFFLVSAVYVSGLGKNQSALPPGCTRPSGGYLIIASINGYNDSIAHGAPFKSWPIINVTEGSTVRLTICNADKQAHGFEISHYYDSAVETVPPGQTITVSFVADQTGSFQVYCDVFCTIHVFMQNGELVVSR